MASFLEGMPRTAEKLFPPIKFPQSPKIPRGEGEERNKIHMEENSEVGLQIDICLPPQRHTRTATPPRRRHRPMAPPQRVVSARGPLKRPGTPDRRGRAKVGPRDLRPAGQRDGVLLGGLSVPTAQGVGHPACAHLLAVMVAPLATVEFNSCLPFVQHKKKICFYEDTKFPGGGSPPKSWLEAGLVRLLAGLFPAWSAFWGLKSRAFKAEKSRTSQQKAGKNPVLKG